MSEKGKLRINLEYWWAQAVLGLFRRLKLPRGMALGRAIGRFGFWFPKLRRTGERNLELAFPDLPDYGRRRLLRGSFENLGRLLAIFSHFAQDNDAVKSMIAVEGLEQFSAASAGGKGVILFTGHVGAWELSSFGLSLFGHPL